MNIEKVIKVLEKKSVFVHSFNDYLNLPLAERTKCFGLWYKMPFALPVKMFNNDDNDETGTWEDFDKWAKSNYPVQFFMRDTFPAYFYPIRRKLKDCKWKIYAIFKPQHRELHKIIGREWRDLVYIIPNILFECVKSYVDKELKGDIPFHDVDKCENEFEKPILIDWNNFYKGFTECYNYIIMERPLLNEKLDKENDNAIKDERKNLTYGEKYAESIKIEKELKEKDDKYLSWILEYREMFWT